MNIIKNLSSLLKDSELKNEPVVIRVNKFDESAAKTFKSQVSKAHNTGQNIIPVIVDSYGGQVYSLMSMISDIKNSKLPIATIVQGKAMSCGALLFSFGAEGHRYMDEDATLMIHDVSSMNWGKVEEIKASADETSRLNKKVYQMMAQNCGKRKNYFLDIIHEKGHADWFLEYDEAKKHNLANHSEIPELKIDVTVSFEFK
jgi:ATP-dependent Clp protease protease subunit